MLPTNWYSVTNLPSCISLFLLHTVCQNKANLQKHAFYSSFSPLTNYIQSITIMLNYHSMLWKTISFQNMATSTTYVIKNFPYQRPAVTTLRPTTHIKNYNWAGWCNSHALDTYSRSIWFKYKWDVWWFFTIPDKNMSVVPQLGQEWSLPYPSYLIIHSTTCMHYFNYATNGWLKVILTLSQRAKGKHYKARERRL